MDSSVSNACTYTNGRSSPTVFQVDRVDEVTASLGNVTLADFSSRDEVTVQNAIENHNVQRSRSTENSVTVKVNSHARETLETEKHLPAGTHDDESLLREQLQMLQCPFTWKIQNESTHDTPDAIIQRINEKLEEIEESVFQWREFTCTLVTCYEHFRKGDISASWDKQRRCETILNLSGPKGIYESFFQATKDALLHVVYSCKCHLFFETGVLNEARETLQTIHKYDEMDNPCKAAIWGIQAAVLMEYGYEGSKVTCAMLILKYSCV
jgi:hypothetical protein